MCCLGAEAHPPPASSPSARSSIRRHCAFLPTQRPSTSRANASLFPAAGASRTNCSTLIAEPKLLVIITNVTIGPGTTAFVSPDATSRIRSLRPRRRPPSPPPPSPPPPSVPPSTLGLASAAVRLRHPYQPDRHRQHPHPHHRTLAAPARPPPGACTAAIAAELVAKPRVGSKFTPTRDAWRYRQCHSSCQAASQYLSHSTWTRCAANWPVIELERQP